LRHFAAVELRRGALQYVPELTWILFLRILDETEEIEAANAAAVGAEFRPSLKAPFRWRDWAAPAAPERKRLTESTTNAFYDFVNTRLIPHLKALKDQPNATPRQKVMSEILSSVDRTRVDTQRNLLDVLDKIHDISLDTVDDTHVFALSQIYEGLLLKMGEKGNDGGQFFTPREVIRAIVEVIAPKAGETVCDPCCGTGGFLAQAYEFMRGQLGEKATGDQIETLKFKTLYGREKENLKTKKLITACEREIREIYSKAESREDSAFYLKAVNPNAKSSEDTRSSAELIDLIEVKGREVLDLMAALRAGAW
jgi:type I restriction enzyme M protein